MSTSPARPAHTAATARARRPEKWTNAYPPRVPEIIERWSPGVFFVLGVVLTGVTAVLSWLSPWGALLLLLVVPYWLAGIQDLVQRRHSVRRNFPVIGRFRYVLESLRPELRQYFVESDQEENPISREKRSIVYQRAKNQLDTLPFGTRRDVYADGYDWLAHSVAPVTPRHEEERVRFGGERVTQPYDASLLNVSAMSYGSLSKNAILALNRAARDGGFYHNTGEGGISPYHLEPGGDLVWQVGTGYFGCRRPDGTFDPDLFAAAAGQPSVRMIELKLSQGAKPGHGGILPAGKVTPEIAAIRKVPLGRDVLSPPGHSAFGTPLEMMHFLDELRRLSGGKPVGFKLCIGRRREFLALCKAMLETDLLPDFITVDGGEGGTGAAPLEFSNSVGMPLTEGLHFVHNALRGCGLRSRVRIVAAGKITTGFHVVARLAQGADVCNAARAMMFALGCIQALKCNTNHCPVGVATQDPRLVRGLDVDDKAARVRSFHARTIESIHELVAAAGLHRAADIGPEHVYQRVGDQVRPYSEVHPLLPEGAFLNAGAPESLQRLWDAADASRF